MTTSFSPSIAIVGAGPAGLTLARLLHVQNPNLNVKLFERDSSAMSRPDQGGTLDLHTDTGLLAIKRCKLWPEFLKHARYDGEEFIVADKNATEIVHMGGGAAPPPSVAGDGADGQLQDSMKETEGSTWDRPEVDRVVLKQILLDSVPEKWLDWGRKLTKVTEDGILHFENANDEGPFDLVIGADGGYSKVRAFIDPFLKPIYAGIVGFEMEIADPAKTCPHVDKMVGRGSYMGQSDQRTLTAQRLGTGVIKVRSMYRGDDEQEAHDAMKKFSKQKVVAMMLERLTGWAPEMLEFLKQADIETLRSWAFYELPVGTTWKHKKGLTLIGDAASLMTPFAGEGVNKAMKDSLELAEAIAKAEKGESDLDEAIHQYEVRMFPRAHAIQRLTDTNKNAIFSIYAPIMMMTSMMRFVAGEDPHWYVRILGTFPFVSTAYSYFWIRVQIGKFVRKFWRRN